jgi:hypothetical protein
MGSTDERGSAEKSRRRKVAAGHGEALKKLWQFARAFCFVLQAESDNLVVLKPVVH